MRGSFQRITAWRFLESLFSVLLVGMQPLEQSTLACGLTPPFPRPLRRKTVQCISAFASLNRTPMLGWHTAHGRNLAVHRAEVTLTVTYLPHCSNFT
jgi:hypothetical protein